MSSPYAVPPEPRNDWRSLHLWQIQPVRDVLVGLGVVALFWLGQRISIVTVPLLLAVLLAYLFEPVIRSLISRFNWSRRAAVMGIIAGVVIVVIVPAALGLTYGLVQLTGFVGRTAENVQVVYESVQKPDDAALRSRLEAPGKGAWLWIRDRVVNGEEGYDWELVLESARGWLQTNAEQIAGGAAQAGATALSSTLSFLGGLFGLGFTMFLTLFFFAFVASGWVQVKDFGVGLLPTRNRDRIVHLVKRFDEVISAFIRGRLTIAFIQAIIFSVGYWIIGVPGAFILGPVVALLSIVPYLALVGVPISIGLLWLEGHTGVRGTWWWVLGAPTAFYFLGQAIDDYVLTPVIQGKSTGMDTPTILFASLAGGVLFGVFGLLVAIPIAACIKILIQEVFWPAFKGWVEGREKDFLPIERE